MTKPVSDLERLSLERIHRAGICVPESVALAWIRSVNPKTILSASLREIKDAANAF